MSHIVPILNDPSLLTGESYIDENSVASSTAREFAVNDPATGNVNTNCPDLTVSEAKLAIDAADKAFHSFRWTTGRSRANLLRAWHDQVIRNAQDIATLITLENGKALVDAHSEVSYAASYIEWFAEEAPRIYGFIIPASVPGKRINVSRQPVGVCALITPWNFPAAMVTRKVAPALAAGCTVVLKSAGETLSPLTRCAFWHGEPEFLLESSMFFNWTIAQHGPARQNTAVGKMLMAQSAPSLKKLSMELGGNSPFIVFADCKNLDEAVDGAIAAKFRESGQICVAANRILIQDTIYDDFVERMTDKVRKFKVGSGFEQGVTHGPLIHRQAVTKVEAHIRDAVDKGAKLMVGGTRRPELGQNFLMPAVLAGLTKEMDILSEETFGPLAVTASFSTEGELVQMANVFDVGLAAYIFSGDIERVLRVSDGLEAGMVGVNTGLLSDAAAPFGGLKESGFGKEGSRYRVEDYTVIKSVTVADAPRG